MDWNNWVNHGGSWIMGWFHGESIKTGKIINNGLVPFKSFMMATRFPKGVMQIKVDGYQIICLN